jgi:hypothetical protein
MVKHRSQKKNRSQALSKGKLLKILWFIPAKVIAKLFKITFSSLFELEDELV